VWVELDEHAFARTAGAVDGGSRDSFQVKGSLACDWPGLIGTMGSGVIVRVNPTAGGELRVIDATDTRLRALRGARTHKQLVGLYRMMFGFGREVMEADGALRSLQRSRWERFAGRPCHIQPVEPPASVAGIRPAELLIAPPLDTGEEALLCTLGNAEASTERSEVACWARNPSDAFIRSFAQFSYWSRVNGDGPQQNILVSDHRGRVPDAQDKSAWLVCRPFFLDEGELSLACREDFTVSVLAAIPVSSDESIFAAIRGPAELIRRFEWDRTDIFDLDRPSVIEA